MTRRILIALLTVLAVAAGASQASAHPLGNFTVNTYLRVEASGGELYLRQVVDMAEIPAFRERSAVDGAGGLGPYAVRRARERAREIAVTIDGRPRTVTPVSQVAAWRPGAGGLQVLRYGAWYRVAGAGGVTGESHRVSIDVASYRERVGWHELVVRDSSGASVANSSAPADDQADELRSYPGGLLSSPLGVTTARFDWSPGEGAGAVGPLTADPRSRVAPESHSGLNGLLDGDLSVGVVIAALLLAMGWGALHSLSPGHGKTMVAAYLVGTRGTARHALLLGLFVTITHTIGVIALGLATLFASQYILPETLFPWINLVAALLVVAVGAWVGWGRLRAFRRRPPASARRGPAGALAVSGVRAPMTRVAPRGHDHHHPRGHGHHDHAHSHGPGGHTHAPPEDLSTRSLLAVGASAGIIPCPSALVLLLGAIALDRVGYGLVLVVAFSLGLAGLLSAIGLLILYARRFVDRLPLDGRIAAAVPALSALVIVVLGLVLTVRAVPGVL
jgi:ABC-type nickel/cobalt efflux system permease component RcnA